MEDHNHLFDSFIKDQLADIEMPVAASQWTLLSTSLAKKGFWHIGLKTFNVFYAGLIGAITILSSISAYYSYQNYVTLQSTSPSEAKQAPTPLPSGLNDQQSHQVVNQQEDAAKETKTVSSEVRPKEVVKNSSGSKPEKNSELHYVLPEDPSGVEHISKGENNKYKLAEMAVAQKIDSVPSSQKPLGKTKTKKIIYLTKRDTIFKADTVRRVRRK